MQLKPLCKSKKSIFGINYRNNMQNIPENPNRLSNEIWLAKAQEKKFSIKSQALSQLKNLRNSESRKIDIFSDLSSESETESGFNARKRQRLLGIEESTPKPKFKRLRKLNDEQDKESVNELLFCEKEELIADLFTNDSLEGEKEEDDEIDPEKNSPLSDQRNESQKIDIFSDLSSESETESSFNARKRKRLLGIEESTPSPKFKRLRKLNDEQDKESANELFFRDKEKSIDDFLFRTDSSEGEKEEGEVIDPENKHPRSHQRTAIEKAKNYFEENDRGTVVMACGSGKTYTGLKIIEALNSNLVLVTVPTLALIKQIKKNYFKDATEPFDYIFVCSDFTVDKDKNKIKNDSEAIRTFLNKQTDKTRIVFSTYQSVKKVADACTQPQDEMISFDFVLCDEAHHVVEANHLDYFRGKIPAKKWLFMTATLPSENPVNNIIPMKYSDIFGELIHCLSFSEAIKRGIISDFKIILVGIRDPVLAKKISKETAATYHKKGDVIIKDTTTSIACHMALAKATKEEKLHHVFSFHSRVKSSERFVKAHDLFLDEETKDLYSDHIDGKMAAKKRASSLKKFKSAESGHIGSAKALSEGIDVPAIDAVFFSDPSVSPKQIIQTVGRALRKNGQENRPKYIIIPVHYRNHEQIKLTRYKILLQTLVSLYFGDDINIKKLVPIIDSDDLSFIDEIAKDNMREIDLNDLVQVQGFQDEIKDVIFMQAYDMIANRSSKKIDTITLHHLSKYREMVEIAKKDPTDPKIKGDYFKHYYFAWNNKENLPPSFIPILHKFHYVTKERFDNHPEHFNSSTLMWQLDSFIYYYDRLPQIDEKFCSLTYKNVFFLRCRFFYEELNEKEYKILNKHRALLTIRKEGIKNIIESLPTFTDKEYEAFCRISSIIYNHRDKLSKYTFKLIKKRASNSKICADILSNAKRSWESHWYSVKSYIESKQDFPSLYLEDGKWYKSQHSYFANLFSKEQKKFIELENTYIETIKKSKEELAYMHKRESKKELQKKRFCFFKIGEAKDRRVLSQLKELTYLEDGEDFKEINKKIAVGPDPKLPFNAFGAFAITNIPAGTVLGFYNGEYVLTSNYDNPEDFYHWGLTNGMAITAVKYGNWTRFMNHSDDPNVINKEVLHNSRIRIRFSTTKDVKEGQRLTLNYGDLYWKAPNVDFSPVDLSSEDMIDCKLMKFCP